MSPVVINDATHGWLCWDHGEFPTLCKCGIIEGQEHDILCEAGNKPPTDAA